MRTRPLYPGMRDLGKKKGEFLPGQNSFSSVPEFHYFLDRSLVLKIEAPMVVLPVFLNCAPEEIPRIASGRNASAAVKMITPDIFSLRIGLRTREAQGYLVNYQDHWTIYLLSKRWETNLADVLTRWVHNLFPLVTPAYVTYLQLIDLVESLKVVEGSHIAVQEYVSRTPTADETIKRWPRNLDFSKKAVRERARKDNAVVDAIKFHLVTPNFKFTAKLSRRGMIIFYAGTYSDFQRLLVPTLVRTALGNLKRLGTRRRLIENDQVIVEPLKITPESQLTKSDLHLLREIVEKNYMTAVLYGGNPWLMLSLIDKSDGSTLDLHAYEDEIIITPVIRVTAQALTRLYSLLEEALPTKIPQYA